MNTELPGLFDHNRPHNASTESVSFLTDSRPTSFDQIVGQDHVINKVRPLLLDLSAHFIFYGAPGCGKTTICRCIEHETNLPVRRFNPVSQTLSELKHIQKEMNGTPYLLSVDEIHRMDKKQQEFLLPFLENGNFKLIASTTENPYTFFTRAIISRTISLKINPLSPNQIEQILVDQKKADQHIAREIAALELNDARKAFIIYQQVAVDVSNKSMSSKELKTLINQYAEHAVYDKNRHYDLISALIKSMRDSEVEEANQWLAHLLVEGGDLMVICRRLMIFASEDIGDAAPYALMKAVACTQAVEKIGLPEAQIILGDCVSFLAQSPKSRVNYERIKNHLQKAKEGFTTVPPHRRNRKS